jgi:DNA repair exonuclease SbcCD ATPase subunit
MRKSILLLFVLLTASFTALAQNSSAFEQTQKMRAELSQLHDREAEIKIRLTELDYDLKPENIERHFAGVGSVHPEELREARRKQLQLEKDRLVGQLSEIDQNQARLETEIQISDSKAYQQSALGASKLGITLDQISPYISTTVIRLLAIVFALIVIGIALLVTYQRRRSRV